MKKKENIKITDRDKKIFMYLFENRLATNLDILHKFYAGKNKRNSRKRLEKLKRNGFIAMAASEGLKQRFFYYLTLKGLETIYSDGHFFKGFRLKSPNPHHDYALASLRNVLKESKMIHEYYTENMIQSDIKDCFVEKIFKDDGNFSPDALFVTKSKGEKFYNTVELELTQKGVNFYRRKIRKYYLNEKISYVLFISNSKTIEKKVMQTEKQLYPNIKTMFYYANFKAFLDKKLPFKFVNCRGVEWNFE